MAVEKQEPAVDPAALEQLRPMLRGYLARRLNDSHEAEDLAQEAFLRLLRVPRPELIRQPEAYLFRICANLANEFLLKRANRIPVSDQQTVDQQTDEGAFQRHIEHLLLVAELEKVMATLPPLYRAVLLMRRRDGYSHKEIAEKLKLSEHTVHAYLTRALARCREGWHESQEVDP